VTSARVVTLLTDFGTADYFVAAVKGVVLTINPLVSLVDITHDIPPQDIETGAFTLLTCYRDFPEGTIHVAVVDPGVGSSRRPIVVRAGGYYFVGPDNGLFSYVYDRESSVEVFHVTADQYFRRSPSPTFHGRDIFAPVAGALSKALNPGALGPQITDQVRLTPLAPTKDDTGKLNARIIHIDRFGNCITNLTPGDLLETQSFKLHVNGKVIETVRRFFTDKHGPKEEIFAIWGSAGFLELAVNGASAAAVLGARRGAPVFVE